MRSWPPAHRAPSCWSATATAPRAWSAATPSSPEAPDACERPVPRRQHDQDLRLRGRPAARRRGEARARRQRRALAARARPQWRRHHRPPSAQPHERAADYAPGEDETFISRVLADRRKTWEPRELVAIGTAHPPLNPGAQWSYSNAGYILIVQAASGKPLEAELRARILASPRLRATSLDTDPRITGRHAHGYSHFARGGASPSASWTSRGPGRPPRSSRPRTSSRASVALLRWPPRRGMIARRRGRASSTARRCSPMRSSMATEPNAGNRCATSSSPGSKQAACATPQERCPQDRVRRARGSRPRCPPPRRSQDRVDTRSALQGVITRVPERGRWNRCHLAAGPSCAARTERARGMKRRRPRRGAGPSVKPWSLG
jgi:hypothetical protein